MIPADIFLFDTEPYPPLTEDSNILLEYSSTCSLTFSWASGYSRFLFSARNPDRYAILNSSIPSSLKGWTAMAGLALSPFMAKFFMLSNSMVPSRTISYTFVSVYSSSPAIHTRIFLPVASNFPLTVQSVIQYG